MVAAAFNPRVLGGIVGRGVGAMFTLLQRVTVIADHIADACAALGVDYLTPYTMLKRARARFVLAPTPTSQTGTP